MIYHRLFRFHGQCQQQDTRHGKICLKTTVDFTLSREDVIGLSAVHPT